MDTYTIAEAAQLVGTSRGKLQSEDVAGLKTFQKDYPEAKVALLAPSPSSRDIEGIPCMDLKVFLLGIIPGKPLPVSR